ncbi:MAG: type II toxin-antitoxin system VapC family toxin [Rhizobiaceae bacterium]|nr:type II toxin-antitoxin system VapC family toxin [Rhizobiaceae bacterium]
MKALDTNILLRFVTRDDEDQFAKASSFLNSRSADDPAFISLIVLVEFVWTLRQRYGRSRSEIRSLVVTLMETKELAFEDESQVSAIVTNAVRGELADHLVSYCARRAGCSSTVTFDQGAAKAVAGMELLS